MRERKNALSGFVFFVWLIFTENQCFISPSGSVNERVFFIEKTFSIASKDNIVLFSPAGSSYDLFKNYEERGNAFKNLLLDYQAQYAKISQLNIPGL